MKTIPEGTKIYKTLSACCKYQQRLPGGCQPVFDAKTKEAIGFVALTNNKYWVR